MRHHLYRRLLRNLRQWRRHTSPSTLRQHPSLLLLDHPSPPLHRPRPHLDRPLAHIQLSLCLLLLLPSLSLHVALLGGERLLHLHDRLRASVNSMSVRLRGSSLLSLLHLLHLLPPRRRRRRLLRHAGQHRLRRARGGRMMWRCRRRRRNIDIDIDIDTSSLLLLLLGQVGQQELGHRQLLLLPLVLFFDAAAALPPATALPPAAAGARRRRLARHGFTSMLLQLRA